MFFSDVDRFDHRVIVRWAEGKKIRQIQEVNRFCLHQAKGRATRRYLERCRDRDFEGLEVSFENPNDAVLFKLSFNV